jgi:hypothetical protein
MDLSCDKQQTEELKLILLADLLGFLKWIVSSVIWLAPNIKETNKVPHIRASTQVLSLWPCTLKWDEEK